MTYKDAAIDTPPLDAYVATTPLLSVSIKFAFIDPPSIADLNETRSKRQPEPIIEG
jgi:hypothetical protein